MSFFQGIFSALFGTSHTREMKRLHPLIAQTGEWEISLKSLTDAELKAKSLDLRERVGQGSSLDEVMPEAFALVRETARRTLDMRHFDVQLLGGAILHEGKIAEMRTGEGKTLVATLPVYLNALTGKGVHVVTVNDYLARRDAEWMGRIYNALGMSVGVIVHDLSDDDRRAAYAADITYGTNNEFGFDYLRDHMKFRRAEQVQRGHHFAIVDEVDSILVDEARTPLIISGPTDESTDKYYVLDQVVPQLRRDLDYAVDEKGRVATLTDEGIGKVEKILGIGNLYDPSHVEVIHHVNQALRAHALYRRDVDYVVKEGEVIIVDEFTGRLMPGRRWSDGLHQAIEAKERVKIENENQTLATITFQNYFRLYQKLAGMTGTAETEKEEFEKIYNLKVVVIPTHRAMVRLDHDDLIFGSEEEKYDAIVEDVSQCHQKGRPVLVGTVSIEKSERLSRRLTKLGVPHHVLNAKHHAREAEIIAQAGRLGAVTIATNMAGRGTDILLGGNANALARTELGEGADATQLAEVTARYQQQCEVEHQKVVAVGGLHVIGSERHESRRVDNQLRGRAGRQGDPGSSRFFLSLEDDLLRIFGGEKIQGIMDKVGLEKGEPIEHPWLGKAVENAQKRLEGQHFGIRKQLTEFDSVLNQQRGVIYGIRQQLLEEEPRPVILEIFEGLAADLTREVWPDGGQREETFARLLRDRLKVLVGESPTETSLQEAGSREELQQTLTTFLTEAHLAHTEPFGEESTRQVERFIVLNSIDGLWKEHLLEMDHLRDKVGLVGYAQQQPLQVYRREGFEQFERMLAERDRAVVERLFRVQLVTEPGDGEAPSPSRGGGQSPTLDGPAALPELKLAPLRKEPRVGRNDPCPCGSGKKYKKCHMERDVAGP